MQRVVLSARLRRHSEHTLAGSPRLTRQHSSAGIQRVAILDPDVHHGNGTEACVAACAPHVLRFGIKTPFCEGAQAFPVYRPWLGLEDSDNILFARCAHSKEVQMERQVGQCGCP